MIWKFLNRVNKKSYHILRPESAFLVLKPLMTAEFEISPLRIYVCFFSILVRVQHRNTRAFAMICEIFKKGLYKHRMKLLHNNTLSTRVFRPTTSVHKFDRNNASPIRREKEVTNKEIYWKYTSLTILQGQLQTRLVSNITNHISL